MNIYYINIEEFKQTHDKNFLSEYADKRIENEKRFFEYSIGRYLIKNVAKKIYKINDCEITINKNGKPQFKNYDLNFSLSHSKDYAVVCFDENECGIDIEFSKERNFEKISQHYNKNFLNADEFYRFWTLKEATYKQHTSVKDYYTTVFKNNYYLTVTSEKVFEKPVEIIKFN